MPTKTFEEPDLVQGSPFTAYAGVDCPPMGMNDSDAIARARRRLTYVQPRWVDMHVAAMIETEGTQLGPFDLLEFVIPAEVIIGMEYGGYGTILITKDLLVCADHLSIVSRAGDGGLETVNGTRVAGINPGPTSNNFYVTGQITLLEGPVRDRITPSVTLPDGTCVGRRALAERTYVPLIECLMYYGTATCTPVTP